MSRRRDEPEVEPRLRERRDEVQRDQSRRRRRVLTTMVGITLVGAGAVLLSQSEAADIDEIVVEGAQHSDVEAVRRASGIQLGEPLIDLDSDEVVAGVTQLPWVMGVSVEREIDGSVVVSLSERQPALTLGTEAGGYVLIDETGRQLELVPSRAPDDLPVAGLLASGVVGEPTPSLAQAVLRTVAGLTPELRAEVSQILVDQGEIYLELTRGGRARLGDDSSLEEKLISLETMLVSADTRCLWEIDVRVPSAPALTRVSSESIPRASLTDLATCS